MAKADRHPVIPKPRSLPFESPRPVKATGEQIVAAYRDTGSVWAAGKRLGMCGQSVWERLRALDYPMHSMAWSHAEIAELRTLAGTCTIGEIAARFGRPYAGVAGKISELQIGSRYGNRQRRKPIAGYPKRRVQKLIDLLEAHQGSLRQFCRLHSLDLEYFIGCIQRIDRPFWEDYTRRKSDLTAKICPNCGTTYYPLTKKQQTCSRRCSSHQRVNAAYFGGKRNQAIGLAEGICQLCMTAKPRLSAHHAIGKANDPENAFLIALCAGCHQLVGLLAGRLFADTPLGWENLINLVLARRLADKNRDGQTEYVGTHVAVDIDWLTGDDLECEDVDPPPKQSLTDALAAIR